MTLKPTDLRSSPFEVSSMINLASYELNHSKIDNLLKLKQTMVHNPIDSKYYSDKLSSLIDDKKDLVLFIEMMSFLQFLKRNELENLGNIYFNSIMCLDLKEKFSSSSKVKIHYLSYLFAFQFDFLHIDWLKTFSKIIDLIKIINTYLVDLIQKDDKLSNILHIMIVPLNIYSKKKNLQNTYGFCIGINDLSNDLYFFLEEFRDLQYARLKVPESSKPELTLITLPVILLNHMQVMRKFLFKFIGNPNYKEIKSLILKEIEFLFNEKQETQKKVLELKLKLEKYDKCQVFLIDISEIDDGYFSSFENKKRFFFSVFNHVGSLLFKNYRNMSFCCHRFKGILLICFQYNSEKQDSLIESIEFNAKYRFILTEIYAILSKKYECSAVFFSKINSNNEEKPENLSQEALEIKNSLKPNVENLAFFEISHRKLMEAYKEKTLSKAFSEEIWLQKIFSLCKRMELDSYIYGKTTEMPLVSALEILNRIERIKFLQNELVSHKIFEFYRDIYNLRIENFKIISIPDEYALFFYRILGFFLRKKERLVSFVCLYPQKILLEIIFNEIFNEFSNDFYNLTEFMTILVKDCLGQLLENFISKDFLNRSHVLLIYLTNYFNSYNMNSLFLDKYILLLETSFQEKELDLYLYEEKQCDLFFIQTLCIVIFDVDNLKNIDYFFKKFILLFLQITKEVNPLQNFSETYNFITKILIFLFIYSYYSFKSNLKKISSKGMKIENILKKFLFSPAPWFPELNIYVENFLAFLENEISFISNEKNCIDIFSKKSEFLHCNRFILKSSSLLNLIYLLKLLKVVKNEEIHENLVLLKEFLWEYPKLDNIEIYLKKNNDVFVDLNFGEFLSENTLFPLNFLSDKQSSKKIENNEIISFLNDTDGRDFLTEIEKINPQTKINNLEIKQLLNLKKNSIVQNKRIVQTKNVENLRFNSTTPEQKILDRNPYISLTNSINFFKIDKKAHKLACLIEVANNFIFKGKILRSDHEIETFLKNANKNFEELKTYKNLCQNTAIDNLAMEKIYEKYKKE